MRPDLVAYTCNPITWEAEAGRFLLVSAWADLLHGEFQDTLDYIGRPFLKKPNPTNQTFKYSLTSQRKTSQSIMTVIGNPMN